MNPFNRTPIKHIPAAEETVIAYKGVYLHLLIDKDGVPLSIGWSKDATMFNVPVREFWTAVAPEGKQ